MKNAMFIMTGVLCVFSLAILLGSEYRWSLTDREFRAVVTVGFAFFVAALPFAFSAYGLATKRWWATPLSLILIATVLSPVVFDFSTMGSPIGPIFWLLTIALPFVTFLEILQIRAWTLSRRQRGA